MNAVKPITLIWAVTLLAVSAAWLPGAPQATAQRPAAATFAHFGEEAKICLDRLCASLDEKFNALEGFWGAPMAGKSARDEWQALAGALYDDLDLYSRAAVDSARDAVKERTARASSAEVDQLKARTDKTLQMADHVFRRKGQEVAIFRDTVQGYVNTLKEIRITLGPISTRLLADLGHANDVATGVYTNLQSGRMSMVELENAKQKLEMAKRTLQAYQRVRTQRILLLNNVLRQMSPAVVMEAYRKAADNWVPSDIASGTFLTAEQARLVNRLPADLRTTVSDAYSGQYQQAQTAVQQFASPSLHQIGLFRNVTLANLDKALDPYLNQCKSAIEARRAYEQTQREVDDAVRLADADLSEAERSEQTAARTVEAAAQRVRSLNLRLEFEADRKQYEDLLGKFQQASQTRNARRAELVQLRSELGREQSARAGSQAELAQRVQRIATLRRNVATTLRAIQRLDAQIEAIEESLQALRRRVTGS